MNSEASRPSAPRAACRGQTAGASSSSAAALSGRGPADSGAGVRPACIGPAGCAALSQSLAALPHLAHLALAFYNCALRDDAVKARHREWVDLSLEKGVFGVPTFVVDGEMFWGADRVWMVERWLETEGW